jgi:hypothetical protein
MEVPVSIDFSNWPVRLSSTRNVPSIVPHRPSPISSMTLFSEVRGESVQRTAFASRLPSAC